MLKNVFRKIIIISRYLCLKLRKKKLSNGRIITFHEITDIIKFEKKIIFLKKNYIIISIEEILNQDIDNSITITFDDGYLEWSNEVYDVLVKHNIPALFFVNSGILMLHNKKDSARYIKNNLKRTKQLDLLDISGVKKIAKNKLFTIGGHTRNHIDLGIDQDISILNENIIEEKKYLENIIAKEIKYFAFPFGRFKNINSNSIRILKQVGYDGLFSIIPSFINKNYILPRDSLSIYDSDLYWKAWLSGAYDFKSKREYSKLIKEYYHV